MSTSRKAADPYAPQQARSRRAREQVLSAAAELLGDPSVEEFTMAVVAERAGVSIGAIYRRFDSREHLLAAVKERVLGEYEADLAARLDAATPTLEGVITAFTYGIADALFARPRVASALLAAHERGAEARGIESIATTRSLFRQAIAPHRSQVEHADPERALAIVQAMITSACIHRCVVGGLAPDDLAWDAFVEGINAAAIGYLRPAG